MPTMGRTRRPAGRRSARGWTEDASTAVCAGTCAGVAPLRRGLAFCGPRLVRRGVVTAPGRVPCDGRLGSRFFNGFPGFQGRPYPPLHARYESPIGELFPALGVPRADSNGDERRASREKHASIQTRRAAAGWTLGSRRSVLLLRQLHREGRPSGERSATVVVAERAPAHAGRMPTERLSIATPGKCSVSSGCSSGPPGLRVGVTRAPLTARHENRARGRTHNLLGDAAERQQTQPCPASWTDHDELGTNRLRLSDDGWRGGTIEHLALGVDLQAGSAPGQLSTRDVEGQRRRRDRRRSKLQ